MANITTQTIRVDLSTDKVIPSAFTHQNDTARTLVFDMYNGGMPYTMTGNTVKFAYKSPIVNGQYSVIAGASMASGTVSGNKVTVALPVAYTRISGVGLLTMIITPSSGTIRPVNIRLVVQKSADGDDTILNASDWPEGLYEYMDDWLAENEPTEIANLKSDLNYNHTAEPGYVLRATDSGHGNEWAMVGTPTDAQAETAINKWLDDHPEATTTVQDGAITEVKFADSLKLKAIKDYVTPEMFGAKGDGVTDDSTAISDAVATGFPVYGINNYNIGNGISITNNYAKLYISGTITGNEGIEVLGCKYVDMHCKEINSNGEYAVCLHSTTSTKGVSHTSVIVEKATANNGCGFYLLSENDGYVNENSFMRSDVSGAVAVKLKNASSKLMDGNLFFDIDIERATAGFVFENTGNNAISHNYLYKIRLLEFTSKIAFAFKGAVRSNYIECIGARTPMFSAAGLTATADNANIFYGTLLSASGGILFTDYKVFNNDGLAFAPLGVMKEKRLTVASDIEIKPENATASNYSSYTTFIADSTTEYTVKLSRGFVSGGIDHIKLVTKRGRWTPKIVDYNNNVVYSESELSTMSRIIDIYFDSDGVRTESRDTNIKRDLIVLSAGNTYTLNGSGNINTMTYYHIMRGTSTYALYISYGTNDPVLIAGTLSSSDATISSGVLTAVNNQVRIIREQFSTN